MKTCKACGQIILPKRNGVIPDEEKELVRIWLPQIYATAKYINKRLIKQINRGKEINI